MFNNKLKNAYEGSDFERTLFIINFQKHLQSLSIGLFSLPFIVACSHAKLSDDHLLSIAAARTQPLGTMVTVEGSITTPPGVFESSFLDKGFGLQDQTGGIYISLQSNITKISNQQASVSGTLDERSGLLILVPDEDSKVTSHGTGYISPQKLSTGAIGESTEGRIVNVAGKITKSPVSDLPYGYKFFIDDGTGEIQIFVNVQTGIEVSSLKFGRWVSVTGFSSQFNDDYEINPRNQSDISFETQ